MNKDALKQFIYETLENLRKSEFERDRSEWERGNYIDGDGRGALVNPPGKKKIFTESDLNKYQSIAEQYTYKASVFSDIGDVQREQKYRAIAEKAQKIAEQIKRTLQETS